MTESKQTSKEIKYAEPIDFFPESVRKEFGLGEFCVDEEDQNQRNTNS